MKKITLTLALLLGVFSSTNAQTYSFLSPASSSVERIAKFSVTDAASIDVLEIVNGTQYDGQFSPTIWAHRGADNRSVLRFFSTINSTVDNGSTPIMSFQAQIRNSIYDSYVYPWGSQSSDVVNRPLFAWYNGNNIKMIMKPDGNLGLGTTSPTARIHSVGTVRFQNLPNSNNPLFLLGTDSSGNVKEYDASSISGGSDIDWLDLSGDTPSSINDNIYTLGNVGINTSNPTAKLHAVGTVRLQNLANATNPLYLLGTDTNGNVKEYNANSIGGNDVDWLNIFGNQPTSISEDIYTLGKVGVNVNNPSHQLHIVGSDSFSDPVRIENLQIGKDRYFVTVDKDGVLHKNIMNDSGVSLNCSSVNYIPKITSSNNLGCSNISDAGQTVGVFANGNTTYNIFNGSFLTGPLMPPSSGYVRLNVSGVSRMQALYLYSDGKFKDNVKDIRKPLDIITNLNGKTYNWTKEAQEKLSADNGTHIGFIAQEVKEVLPEIVMSDDSSNLSVNYQELIPVLVEAIKDQQKQIEELKKILQVKRVYNGNISIESDLNVFPNPSDGVFHIDLSNFNNGRIYVVSINGNKVYEDDFDNQKTVEIDLRKFSNGMYTVVVETNDRKYSKKIIKK